MEAKQADARHNEIALRVFYEKHNPARVADVKSMLERYEPADLVSMSMLLYKTAPKLHSGGKLVVPVVTEELKRASRTRLRAGPGCRLCAMRMRMKESTSCTAGR